MVLKRKKKYKKRAASTAKSAAKFSSWLCNSNNETKGAQSKSDESENECNQEGKQELVYYTPREGKERMSIAYIYYHPRRSRG